MLGADEHLASPSGSAGTPSSLAGAVALVTGASSGIGRATAHALARDGAAVAALGRRGEQLESLVAELAGDDRRALALPADVGDPAAVRDAVERTVAALGRLDVLVANAGVLLPGPIDGAPAQEWDRMLDVNVRGLLACVREALPHLRAAAAEGPRGISDVVLVGSTAGRRMEHNLGVYGATKAAVAALAESLRRELAGRGVRVGHVAPGHTATELGDHGRAGIDAGDGTPGVAPLAADEVAAAIRFVVTRPRGAAVNELAIRPAGQWN